MKSALILMTIMGCDDTATQCHYIETVDRTYATVADCNGETDKRLDALGAQDYPMILAVCEAKSEAAPVAAEEKAAIAAPPTVQVDAGMPATPPRPSAEVSGKGPEENVAIQKVSKGVLASVRDKLKLDTVASVAMAPVHLVTDSYAWVVRKVSR